MAATHFGPRDWMFGYSANVTLSNGNTEPAYLAGVVLSDSLGAEYNAANPLPVAATLSGTSSINLAQVAGTNTVTGGVAGLLAVAGNIASGTTESGNPLLLGATYVSSFTTVTTGQRTRLIADSRGNLRTLLVGQGATAIDGVLNTDIIAGTNNVADATGTVRPLMVGGYYFNGTTWDRARGTTAGLITISPQGWSYAAASGGIVNTTTAVTLKGAAGAGIRNYLKTMQLQTTGALGAATEIAVRDGAGGTVIWRGFVPLAGLVSPVQITFDPPIYSTAATLLEFVTLTASVTGGVYVDAQGYTTI